jgi:hypothetical protein
MPALYAPTRGRQLSEKKSGAWSLSSMPRSLLQGQVAPRTQCADGRHRETILGIPLVATPLTTSVVSSAPPAKR